jgi:hypothetical protein
MNWRASAISNGVIRDDTSGSVEFASDLLHRCSAHEFRKGFHLAKNFKFGNSNAGRSSR